MIWNIIILHINVEKSCASQIRKKQNSWGTLMTIHIIFSGNIYIHSLLSWVVYIDMYPWELYDPLKMICILYLSCSAGYICICSLRNVAIFSLGLRPRENIATFLRGTYTYIPCRAWYIYTIYHWWNISIPSLYQLDHRWQLLFWKLGQWFLFLWSWRCQQPRAIKWFIVFEIFYLN